MIEEVSIQTYYDHYVETQLESGINDRIYGLYRRMLTLGLQSGSYVLELGCGIGTLTYLLSRKIKIGKIEAVDLSPASIAVAQKKVNSKQVQFFAHDIVDFQTGLLQIDFITLFDIIEHIPLEQHRALFTQLRKNCQDHTRILINIPNPSYLHFTQENEPDSLQIIDQPIPFQFLLKNLEMAGFELLQFETYSVWNEKDYQFFELVPKRAFQLKKISDGRTLGQKAIKKIWRQYLKLKFPF